MHSPNRRRERRVDVIEMLKREYRVQDVIDNSKLEQDELFFEGTGAMVLDHVARVAYACGPIALTRLRWSAWRTTSILSRWCLTRKTIPVVRFIAPMC